MRILFVMLAHEHVAQAAETARTLVTTAQEAHALIHLDASCSASIEEELAECVEGEPRIALVQQRVACGWGSFGLVEAVLNALDQAVKQGQTFDYVILLSGACLPHKPIAQLERFLSENRGQEFIENGDESWILDGWRKERYLYRFWFNHKTHPRLERAFFKLQRTLKLKRQFPDGLVPRFGSQWWALTWETCRKIIAYNQRHPRHLRFFRQVWIPDEMYFPTLVHHLVPARVAGYGLTHYKFSDKGKPLVYHDDHVDHLAEMPKFFFRKADPEATDLRSRALSIAGRPDDGSSLQGIAAPYLHYERKVVAQTFHPSPGQIFYRDQWVDQEEALLRRVTAPYVILLMPRQLAAQVGSFLSRDTFEIFGEIFAREEVDLGPRRDSFGGLSRSDRAIRDHAPALYLARLRQRCTRIPVITCCPMGSSAFWKRMVKDPYATVVASRLDIPPWAQKALKTKIAKAKVEQSNFRYVIPELQSSLLLELLNGLAQILEYKVEDPDLLSLLIAHSEAQADLPPDANLIGIVWQRVFRGKGVELVDLENFRIQEKWQEILISDLDTAISRLTGENSFDHRPERSQNNFEAAEQTIS